MSKHPERGIQYFNGLYVYYKSLLTTNYYPMLGEAATIRLESHVAEESNAKMIATYFRGMATAELSKEMALINEKFGGGISGDYTDNTFAKRLIQAINECMGIKQIFERNLALILQSKGGQKNVMSYFPTYFYQVWQTEAPIIAAKI